MSSDHRADPAPAYRLTDSTLRDGSHALAHQFTPEMVSAIAGALDRAGVPVIEVSHGDGLGGSSFNYGFSAASERALIAAAAMIGAPRSTPAPAPCCATACGTACD